MLFASMISAGLDVMRQHGALEELAIQRVVKVGQSRRYWFRAETTSGLDEYAMEYDVVVKTVLVEKQPRFVFTISNIKSAAGAQRLSKPGISVNLVTDASPTGWLTTPSFAEGMGATGLPLTALCLPRIGKLKQLANPAITSLDGYLINGFALAKDAGWPEVKFTVPISRGGESGALWLHSRYRSDGWPEWCDGNWQIGDSTLVFRLERR